MSSSVCQRVTKCQIDESGLSFEYFPGYARGSVQSSVRSPNISQPGGEREWSAVLIIWYKYLSSQQSWRIGQIKINGWADVRVLNDIKNTLGLNSRRCWAILLSLQIRLRWHNWGPNCWDNFSRDRLESSPSGKAQWSRSYFISI